MANIFDFFFVIFNEIRSYFVPEKVSYEITGECKKCGKCCNYMYSKDTYTEKEFKIMQFLFPAYKRFYIKGKDDAKRIFYPGKLHEGCGYKVNVKTFEDYLSPRV